MCARFDLKVDILEELAGLTVIPESRLGPQTRVVTKQAREISNPVPEPSLCVGGEMGVEGNIYTCNSCLPLVKGNDQTNSR